VIGRLLKGVPSVTPLYTIYNEKTLNKVNKQKKFRLCFVFREL